MSLDTSVKCPLNAFTSRTFVINLPQATERLSNITLECKKVGLEFEVFSATDGRKEKIPFTPNREHGEFWNAGSAGLVHTLIRLLKKCIEDPLINSILIVEDDAEFSANFNKVIENNLKYVPGNWEMVFMGLNKLLPGKHVAGNIYQIPHRGGYAAHCVAIRRSIFSILIDLFSKFCEPSDATFCDKIFIRGKSFSICPNIAAQRAGFSYILNQDVNYDFLRRQ